MVIYKSDVKPGNAVYTISGDWFSCADDNGVISFHLPKGDRVPLYLNLFGFPGEDRRDEIDRLIDAVEYMRQGPRGLSQADFGEGIAHRLGMKYGRYMEKVKRGEIKYLMKKEG